MSNAKPEDLVKAACLSKLEDWQIEGVVVDFDDVSNLGRGYNKFTGAYWMKTTAGKRDIIAFFKVRNLLWTYLIECKAPDGGDWNAKQQAYAEQFKGLCNCLYEVVSDAKQVDVTLDKITGHTANKFKEIDVHMGLTQEEIF